MSERGTKPSNDNFKRDMKVSMNGDTTQFIAYNGECQSILGDLGIPLFEETYRDHVLTLKALSQPFPESKKHFSHGHFHHFRQGGIQFPMDMLCALAFDTSASVESCLGGPLGHRSVAL